MFKDIFKRVVGKGVGGAGSKKNAATIGKVGEDMAVKLLKGKGYKILDRNFRTRLGEVDIIARAGARAGKNGTLVFVEVKARGKGAYSTSLEAVDLRKRARVVKAALEYMTRHSIPEDTDVRFDVVGFDLPDKDNGGGVSDDFVATHIEGAFGVDE